MKDKFPKHIAVIMDGNGRWAEKKNLPRTAGHKVGTDTIKMLIEESTKMEIKQLTLFAFSTENWKRSGKEVKYLMDLPVLFLKKELKKLKKENVKINVIGKDEDIPKKTIQALREAKEKTKDNTGLVVTFAFNYGGREEIQQMTRKIAEKALSGELIVKEIDEKVIEKHLYTKDLNDVDLLIRTSGEYRISNFLLYQIAYAELVFTDTLFPDFDKEEYIKIIKEFGNRNRRFGGVEIKEKTTE